MDCNFGLFPDSILNKQDLLGLWINYMEDGEVNDWGSESDIQGLVRQVLKASIYTVGLEGKVKCFNELSILTSDRTYGLSARGASQSELLRSKSLPLMTRTKPSRILLCRVSSLTTCYDCKVSLVFNMSLDFFLRTNDGVSVGCPAHSGRQLPHLSRLLRPPNILKKKCKPWYQRECCTGASCSIGTIQISPACSVHQFSRCTSPRYRR